LAAREFPETTSADRKTRILLAADVIFVRPIVTVRMTSLATTGCHRWASLWMPSMRPATSREAIDGTRHRIMHRGCGSLSCVGMALENPRCGCTGIQGALYNLGHVVGRGGCKSIAMKV